MIHRLLFYILILLFFTNCRPSNNTPTDRQPNVIFLLVDDLDWADLGCYGSTFHEISPSPKMVYSTFTSACIVSGKV